ncbi:MAG: RsmB/NOP family class I SAM-dependent RNA methyltransferase [Fervidicoccaceae archaeon]
MASERGYPPYMVERYLRLLGSSTEVAEFLESVERGIPKTIRCNTLAIDDCAELKERLERRGVTLEKIRWLPHGYRVLSGVDVIGRLEEHIYGLYYIQGPGSMAASYVLDPRRNSLVADLAAAPGGKTTHLAQLMENTGAILSVDKSRARIRALISNVQRMRATNVVVLLENMLKLRGLDGLFDKVLLDAPCSGEGLLPVKEERRYVRTLLDLAKMSSLQVRMLEKAVELARDGGHVLYATCSIGIEENELVIHHVLERREDLEVLDSRLNGVGEAGVTEYGRARLRDELRRCSRLYPHIHSTEGFFLCLLRKRS